MLRLFCPFCLGHRSPELQSLLCFTLRGWRLNSQGEQTRGQLLLLVVIIGTRYSASSPECLRWGAAGSVPMLPRLWPVGEGQSDHGLELWRAPTFPGVLLIFSYCPFTGLSFAPMGWWIAKICYHFWYLKDFKLSLLFELLTKLRFYFQRKY